MKSPVRENRPPGSVRGAPGNRRPYRDFCYTNLLSFTANSVPGIVSSNVVVTLNGVKATGLTFSGSSHALNVAFPIATNAVYALKGSNISRNPDFGRIRMPLIWPNQ